MKNFIVLPLALIIITFTQLLAQPPKSRIFGVVMGISKYQNVPSLKYADRDALSFYDFLLSPAGGSAGTNNIRLLLNEKATSYNFFEAMDNLLDMAKEGDQVYIYFAGHGDIEKKTDRQNGFLIGYNAPPNCYAAGGCIGVKYLQDYVETLVASKKAKVVLIVDACRSGKLAGGSQGAEITALALQAEWKGVTKILSCQPGETSLEGDNWGGGAGVFTYFLLRGLKGLADEDKDGIVSIMELNNFLDKNVLKETNKKQLPEIIGDRRQDIAKVHEKTYFDELNQLNQPIKLSPNIQSAGFEIEVSTIPDETVSKLYEKFKECINENNLISYKDGDEDKENAYSIYQEIEKNPKAKSIIGSMKGELLAALQNKAQIVMNEWIESSYNYNQEYYQNSYQELNTAFSLADTSDPQYYQIKYRYLFWKSQDEKDSLKAIKLLEECIKINPDESFAFLGIGTIYHNRIKNYEKALSYFDKALELSNNSSLAWTDRGNSLLSLGKNEEAIKCFDTAIKIKPDIYGAWNNKGNALKKLGKYESAIKCFDTAIKIKPDFYLAWHNKGLALNDLGKYEEAIKCFDEANKIKPDLSKAWHSKGIALGKLGKYEEAIKCLDEAIKIKPDDYDAWTNKGIALAYLGKYESAIKCYDTAIKIKPDCYEAWCSRGIALSNLGKSEEAIKCFDTAIKIKPDDYQAWNNKGSALGMLMKYEEALKCYDKALEIDINNWHAWYRKGGVLSRQERYDEAFKCYDKLLEKNSDDYKTLDVKGYYLFKSGKHDEGLNLISKALEVNPGYANAWYNKAYCYGMIKNKSEMLKFLKKAIELNKKYKVDAPKDEDFKEYWNDPKFLELAK